MNSEIFDRVVQVLSKQFGGYVPENGLSVDQALTGLDINSVDFVKMVIALESEFGFEFDDDDVSFNRFKNLGDLVSYIEAKT
ncbi:MAG: acyl carrier protein [Clostridia bacterium]|nr:acyl carrier protein [Clostridia bacterium]